MELNVPVRTICGIPVHALTMREVVDIADECIQQRRRAALGVVNVAKLINMHDDPTLREAVLRADVVVADGMGVVWASRWLGQPLPERVPGIDIMDRLLDLADRKGYGVYLLGAKQEVLENAVAVMKERYPNAQLAGCHHGYFTDEDEHGIVAEIQQSKAHMLFIGMSSPKKEIFLDRWGSRLGVSICHGVGGSLDILGGFTKRAPRIWQRLGLEWLYRIRQEPRRMWKRYLVTNCRFAWMVLGELARGRRKDTVQRFARVNLTSLL